MKIEDLVPLAERLAILANETWRCASLVNDSENSDLPGLVVVRKTHPSQVEASIYNPVLGLVLQGSAEVSAGAQSVSFTPGDLLLVSHELPVATRIRHASLLAPYLAVFVSIDLGIIRSLAEQAGDSEVENKNARSLEMSTAEPALIDALGRYLSLSGSSVEADVLIPLIRREVHFRMLVAPHGGMLRNLLSPGGNASKIAGAIKIIRANFRKPLALGELASAVGMSQSSFHAHFKSITGATPLQYQKDLRMIEARRILSEGSHTVAAAAFIVGYESASQFSREYARKFGASPRHDLGQMDTS
ncbi:AraC family transcriptional regulator [Rhizobium sp. P40RR-XXII]|uniref:AraC family transcriptional regulator n=1 Tax=Rhizobium sp. P40RR-XXII TaxID=2726739 RepID=UPI0014569E49|nr:AraC family transcriptional regulator [Rhizobium sp. P40RR-XXII]NLS20695.1 AraC family transcriptional regulator [Rhizobium sp. P40RR-XXII]